MMDILMPKPSCKRQLVTACVFSALLGLAGCAGAHVTQIKEAMALQSPVRVIVQTSFAQGKTEPTPDMLEAARALQSDVLKALTKAHIPVGVVATPVPPAAMPSSGVVLDMHIVSVDPGDLAERLALGFGLGRSKLLVKVRLIDGRHSPFATLLTFDVASDSGRGPGLILPAGVAVGTANAVGFAIGGGTGLLLNVQNGPGQDAAHTAAAITIRLSAYFAHTGWMIKA